MKKKLLSIFLSLSLIFSSIASMSVSFAEENSSTEKVVQQDGIEVRMDMKAGSSFSVYKINYGNYGVKQYFDNGQQIDEKDYDKYQIMKIVIDIPKKNGLVVKNITPMQKSEGIPEEIKNSNPDYFKIKESKDKYLYNFYFLKNGEYEFQIDYMLNGQDKSPIKVKYKAEDLIKVEDFYMRAYLICNYMRDISGDDRYLTETFLKTVLEDSYDGKRKITLGHNREPGFPEAKIAPKIKSLDGIQYFGDNLKAIILSGPYGFNSIESIAPIAEGYYPSLDKFEITIPGNAKPTIPEQSYTPELITECIRKMPNLQVYYITGTGFKNLSIFNGMKNLNDIYSSKNGIKSEDLKGIGILENLSSITLTSNEIFDLTHLNGAIPDKASCDARGQVVKIEKKLLAIEENNKIKIELPNSIIPIDIDGTLTDITNNKVIVKNSSKKIECILTKEGNKKYIEIDKTEFDDIEKIEFSFNFNNKNGNDPRTKDEFTGTVNFKATFNPPVEEYRVLYKFVSGTRGKELPDEVKKLLPVDDKSYIKDTKITSMQPKQNVVVVGDGVWTFKGYDANEKIASDENDKDKDGNIEFIGKWEFEKKVEKATVKYEAKNTSTNRDDGDVDDNILDVKSIKVSDYVNLPKDEKEYNVGETVTLQNPTTTKKINEDGEETGVSTELKPEESVLVKYKPNPNEDVETYVELKFEGYEPEKTNLVAGENTFVGKFKFNDLELVHYDFITDEGKEIPKNIEDKIRKEFKDFEEDELYYDGEKITTQNPIHNEIEDTNGTWKFKGWAYEEDGKYVYIEKEGMQVHHDEEIIGVWHFEPKNTGGGTGGGGTVTPTPNPDKEDPDRVEGDDRIETSIEASEILYPNGTNAVVLANAERFSDVLTANPFAVQEKASALLTYKDKLPEKTLKEIERLGAKKIYVSGGYEAVSKKVVDSLAAKGYEIYRFDGLDRYDTARKIAIKIREKGNKEVVELASGENYPDALCMTSMAVKDNAPILLTKKDSIPKYTKQALAEWDIESVKIGGLDEAISKDVQNQIDKGFEITKGNKADSNVYDGAKKVSRFGGKDRYETSTIIAANSYQESKLGVYATGEDFPDALIAGNYAGRKEAPVLLVKRDTLPKVVEKYTTDSKIEKATVIGGVNAVSDKVFNLIKAAINK